MYARDTALSGGLVVVFLEIVEIMIGHSGLVFLAQNK